MMKKNFFLKPKALLLYAFFLLGNLGLLHAERVAIIDAGSSGSRLFVYEIDASSLEKVKLVYPIGNAQKKGSKGRPLSSVVNHTDSVKVFLQTMTEHFKCETIDLYIFATAGMRLKAKEQADSIYEKLIFQPRINGYKVRAAMTISGQYEGLYGWLAANYENGNLGFKSDSISTTLTYLRQPAGIVEIGGASMQIAFTTTATDDRCLSRPGLGNIYSRSYLGGGVDQIYKNTQPGRRYKFHLDLGKSLSDFYPANGVFMGLGIPINLVIQGAADQTHKRTPKGKMRAYVRTMKNVIDTPENYHPRINAHYIKWLSRELDLEGRLVTPEKDASWTLGAALDIAINKEVPEKFDHSHPN